MKQQLACCKADFLTGLVVVLPVAASIAVVIWSFAAVSHFTAALLLLLPQGWTRNGEGPPHLYWRVSALLAAILLIGLVGRLGRYCFGKKLIQGLDAVLMRAPLLNRMYLALRKQSRLRSPGLVSRCGRE